MKCPRCGFNNPPDTLYCEECDWRLDQRYRGEKRRDPTMFCGIALAVGVVSAVLAFVAGAEMGALALGVVGLVLGSYSINLPRHIETGNKGMLMALAGVGLVCSIVGFMLGFVGVLG